jgi:23S rRNA (guanosine2251-2'-O)-methyltransferase
MRFSTSVVFQLFGAAALTDIIGKVSRYRRQHRRSSSLRGFLDQVAARTHSEQLDSRKYHSHRPDGVPEMVFGLEPIREIIASSPSRIRRLYVKQGAEARFEPLISAVRLGGGEIFAASSNELQRLAGSESRHQGIVAALREYSYASLEQVLASKPDPLLLVDGVTDPRNLGAILRASECAGLNAILLAKDRTVGITPAAIKSSSGAWTHLMVAKCGNVAQTLKHLKAEGYWIAAMDPQGEVSLYELDAARQLALVLGSEGSGIREIVRKTADFTVRIPLYGQVASLNVSVAAAIALFEIVRQRSAPGKVSTVRRYQQ